jgi:putative transposase
MATRKIKFVTNEFYHIYNRGNSKQKIFLDDEDYKRFTQCLYVCNSKKSFNFRDDIIVQNIDAFKFDRGDLLVSIGAWVLMPNHFHIYLTPKSDLGEKNFLSEFMRKVSTAYTKYFNAKYKRTGGLFEGAFKATHVKNDPQAKYLFSYIHLNPVKLIDPTWKTVGLNNYDKTINFLDKYKWSSYLDYKKVNRTERAVLSFSDFPQYFQSIKNFEKEIVDWLDQKVL